MKFKNIWAIHFMVSKVWHWNSTSVKISCECTFFISFETLPLTKLVCLAIIQRMKIIKPYYKNMERPVHHRFARFAENIAILSEIVVEDPNMSLSRFCKELGLS